MNTTKKLIIGGVVVALVLAAAGIYFFLQSAPAQVATAPVSTHQSTYTSAVTPKPTDTTPKVEVTVAAPAVGSLSATSGWTTGGEKVTIKGAGFDKTSHVRFGGNIEAQRVTFVSAKMLEVVTPAEHEGRVQVTVSNKGGWSKATAAGEFTFKVKPAPKHATTPVKPTPAPAPVRHADYCPSGDYTSSHYDGRCGTKPYVAPASAPAPVKHMDYCPNGDYTGNRYDGRCGSKPAPAPAPAPSGGSHTCPPGKHWSNGGTTPGGYTIPPGCYDNMG